MKKFVFTLVVLAMTLGGYAQYKANAGVSIGAGATMFTLGAEREFSVLSDKFHISPGLRVNVFGGSDLDYITAPAKYTVNDDQVDTVTFKSAQNTFANLYVRLGYDFTEKLSLSFDIDLVGVSFGSEQKDLSLQAGEAQRAHYVSNPSVNQNATTAGNPTTLNALLIGDNDIGSLNSTLTLSYALTSKLGLDLGVGLVFTEYTTDLGFGYDGNDRFRNKNLMGSVGVSYAFGK